MGTANRTGRVLLGALSAAALAACAATDTGGPVDAAAVYRARCALCHPAWSPESFRPDEWPVYVRKYAPRAGLTKTERQAVLDWLVAESSAAKK